MTTIEIVGPSSETVQEYRARMLAFWQREAAALRADGNERLAARCDVWASTWEQSGTLDLSVLLDGEAPCSATG